MYNHDAKTTYIKELEDTNRNLKEQMTWAFNRSDEYEERYGKDLCEFTLEEIVSMYKEFSGTSLTYLIILNGEYKRYTNYMILRGVVPDSQNHFAEVSEKILMSCLNTRLFKNKIVTREELMKIINEFLNYGDKFLILGLFEGVYGKGYEDFWNLTWDDFDGNKVKLASGRTLEVSNELVNFAYEASQQFEYNMYIKNENCKRTTMPFIAGDMRIIKDKSNTRSENDSYDRTRMLHKIKNQVNVLRNYTGCPALSEKALRESGRIDMVNRLRLEGEDVKETLKRHKEEIEYRYGTIESGFLTRWVTLYGQFIS